MAIEIVEHKIEGGKGLITVEGDDANELMSPRTRKIAYDFRVNMGIQNAGIEQIYFGPVGPEGVDMDDPRNAPVANKFRRIFRLTPLPT